MIPIVLIVFYIGIDCILHCIILSPHDTETMQTSRKK